MLKQLIAMFKSVVLYALLHVSVVFTSVIVQDALCCEE